nr:ribosomal protein S11 [Meringosphaera mediterranea]
MVAKTKSSTTKKRKIKTSNGVVHVTTSYNNTIVTVTEGRADAISWSSGGSIGFKGTRKGTSFAAQTASETASKVALGLGLKSVEMHIRGRGKGRESTIRAAHKAGLKITSLKDVTGVAHNGCRPPKRRRT